MISLASAGFTLSVSQGQIPFLMLRIFTNCFFPSYPDKPSYQNDILSRCNLLVQAFPGAGQQALIVEESVCKSSLMLHNGLLTEISISLHHPILKTLIKRTEKPYTGEKKKKKKRGLDDKCGEHDLLNEEVFLTTFNSSSVVYVY